MKIKLGGHKEVPVLAVLDDVPHDQVAVLRAGLKKLIGEGKKKIILDLSEVTHIEPEAISEVDAFHGFATELSARIVLVHPMPEALLAASSLPPSTHMPVAKSLDEAVALLSSAKAPEAAKAPDAAQAPTKTPAKAPDAAPAPAAARPPVTSKEAPDDSKEVIRLKRALAELEANIAQTGKENAELETKLGALKDDGFKKLRGERRALEQRVKILQAQLQKYPKPEPESTYSTAGEFAKKLRALESAVCAQFKAEAGASK